MSGQLRLVTWNVHGRSGVDPAVVAGRLAGDGADVAVLQEVQRAQAGRVADALGWRLHWSWKHWPLVVPPEGLAVLTRLPLRSVRALRLSGPVPPWSSRRRIAQLAVVEVGGRALVLAGTHLAAGPSADAEAARLAQADRLLAAVAALGGVGAASRPLPTVVAGDLNARPGWSLHGRLAGARLRDAWAEAHPGAGEAEGATNWGPGGRSGRPNHRLDYVLAGPGVEVVSATVPRPGDEGFGALRRLSDHLPVTVALRLPPAR